MKNKLPIGVILMIATVITSRAATLDAKDTALAKIGAAVARGDQHALAAAFGEGFDAGLSLDEAKEVVGQLYAYCGFPRALNAATTLMKVASQKSEVESQKTQDLGPGTLDLGRSAGLLGDKALAVGTTNQTKLCGGPVAGPLFDFHPQLDAYLKAHPSGAHPARGWRR